MMTTLTSKQSISAHPRRPKGNIFGQDEEIAGEIGAAQSLQLMSDRRVPFLHTYYSLQGNLPNTCCSAPMTSFIDLLRFLFPLASLFLNSLLVKRSAS